VDGLGELLEAPGVEAKHGQVELERILVQDAHDGLLTEDRGQGGDAEVDLALVEAEFDAAVLGQPALRDVEARHDLHAGGVGGVMISWRTPSTRKRTRNTFS